MNKPEPNETGRTIERLEGIIQVQARRIAVLEAATSPRRVQKELAKARARPQGHYCRGCKHWDKLKLPLIESEQKQ